MKFEESNPYVDGWYYQVFEWANNDGFTFVVRDRKSHKVLQTLRVEHWGGYAYFPYNVWYCPKHNSIYVGEYCHHCSWGDPPFRR